MCWQISTIKTSSEQGRNRQFERREKARKNGVKSVLAVFGCQIGKRADSQRNSGKKKHKILWCLRCLEGYIAVGNAPFFGLYLGKDEVTGSNPVSSSSAAARRTSQHPAH